MLITPALFSFCQMKTPFLIGGAEIDVYAFVVA